MLLYPRAYGFQQYGQLNNSCILRFQMVMFFLLIFYCIKGEIIISPLFVLITVAECPPVLGKSCSFGFLCKSFLNIK